MKQKDAERFLDILVRLQIHVEGVKVHEAQEFDRILSAVHLEFQKLLNRVKYKTLDQLTKKEVNILIASLRKSQSVVYSLFTARVEEQLKNFVHASMKVNRIIYASTFVEDDEEMPEEVLTDENAEKHYAAVAGFAALYGAASVARDGAARMWALIQKEPLPANGVLPLAFVKAFSISSQLNLENTIRKGYANAWTPQETVAQAMSQLEKASNNFRAISNTNIEHIAAMVSANFASGLYGKYQWISVIDNSTTEICYDRNKLIFVYGEGPLPPAHIGCRSITMPYFGRMLASKFTDFISRQSAKFKKFALNKEGKLSPKSLSIDDFGESAESIFTG